MTGLDPEEVRSLLVRLGDRIRDIVLRDREGKSAGDLSAVVDQTAADTIYGIDRFGETAVLEWLDAEWPRSSPVELVMEGAEERAPLTFPQGTPVEATRFKCIVDPIDGTRNLMYDKRSAWALVGAAPQKGPETRLSDIVAAAMTEIPVRKQTRCDRISAVRGAGRSGIRSERIDLSTGTHEPFAVQPSRADHFRHGFSSLVRFFPEGKALLAELEEKLWDEICGLGSASSPVIFDDQYISTGGQFYEILAGHDRMLGDLRPLAYRKLGYESLLVCHPYDVAASLILEEAGVLFEAPLGGQVDAPLDTVSAVAWIAFANEKLADLARPVIHRLVREMLGS